jgi:hypothetical protein
LLIGIFAVALVVGLVASGVIPKGGGITSPNDQTAQLGSFAGYIQFVPMSQISASWRVPAILNDSPDGAASTWIGVQGPAQNEFFQVGTTESIQSGQIFYEAFWSDPAMGFHAQLMMPVSAGDEIQATISEVSGNWSASVEDVQTGQTQSAPTRSGVFRNLQMAEFIQEDPSLPHNKHVAYPLINPATIAQLRVNGSAPSYSALQPQIMVLPNGLRIEPGPLVGDQFTTKEVRTS